MFVGEFHHRINAKNQAAVPARFRVVLPDDERKKGLYLVHSSPDCLYLYTHSQIVERIGQASSVMKPSSRREITRRIAPVDMDSQGRIVIPARLKGAVGIEKDVVFIGNADRIELWALERWKSFERERKAAEGPPVEEMMQDLFER